MDPTKELLILQSPRSPSEWDAYFDLRWRILRQPFRQLPLQRVVVQIRGVKQRRRLIRDRRRQSRVSVPQ